VPRKDLEEHITALCEWRIVECGHCSEAYPKCLDEKHLEICKKLPVECPDGCGSIVVREKISDHSSKDCPLTEIFCPYSEMGCNKKIERQLLETHLESAARLHLDLACVKLHRTQEEFKETTRKLEEKVDALEKKLQETVDERVNTLQKKVEAKIDGVQASLTSRIEINDYLYDLRLEREAARVSDDKRESPSFIWKINGMHKILREARRSTDVESEPFFSGVNGYKLKVLMEPSGDLSRSGKNGYVSLFLVIMKGKYDAILPWPFRRTVTFRLIDQQENPDYREDVVMKLDPSDDDSESFLRPRAEENNGYGFAKFICHDKIRRRRYIVNDTAFLEVQVSAPS